MFVTGHQREQEEEKGDILVNRKQVNSNMDD
jgi:hypothetical protein